MTDEPSPVARHAGARRLHIPIQLRWGDLDAFNHVNNTSMLKLLEEARVRAFWRPGTTRTAPAHGGARLPASRRRHRSR